jgi:hypothetical protein
LIIADEGAYVKFKGSGTDEQLHATVVELIHSTTLRLLNRAELVSRRQEGKGWYLQLRRKRGKCLGDQLKISGQVETGLRSPGSTPAASLQEITRLESSIPWPLPTIINMSGHQNDPHREKY